MALPPLADLLAPHDLASGASESSLPVTATTARWSGQVQRAASRPCRRPGSA